jgi:hypothetical protein
MTNQETMQKTIKAQINDDKNHGWGVNDSYQVILAIIANETGAELKDIDNENFGHLIKSVINPSQFRQMLEKAGKLSETKEKRAKNAISDLVASL